MNWLLRNKLLLPQHQALYGPAPGGEDPVLERTAFGPYSFDNTGEVSQGSGPYTTGSFTPPDNSLLVVVVGCGADPVSDAGYVLTGGGLTWTKRVSRAVDWISGDGGIVQIWTAPVTTGASMTLTVTHTSRFSHQMRVFPFAYTGYDTGSPTGVTASGQVTNTNLDITLSGAPAATSEVIAVAAIPSSSATANSVTCSPDATAGFTERAEIQGTESYLLHQVQTRTGSTSTAVGWDLGGSLGGSPYNVRFGVALEIKRAA